MRTPLAAHVHADQQIIAERYGYRKVMMCALVYMSCIFFLHFFAQSLPMLLVAQILVGVPWGSESVHNQPIVLLTGSLPDPDHELCSGCRSSGTSSVSLAFIICRCRGTYDQVSDDLGQRMLGDRTASSPCCPPRTSAKAGRLGMENPLCSSGGSFARSHGISG